MFYVHVFNVQKIQMYLSILVFAQRVSDICVAIDVRDSNYFGFQNAARAILNVQANTVWCLYKLTAISFK